MKIQDLLHPLAAMAAIVCMLSSCSGAPKAADPFDTAINAAMGVMAGGIMGPNVGGAP
ncbi:MAG TPA: hypothetical protein VLE43_10280 [Candidatus Saccharimonadia bacterium]|nr:hypothetical protein [Candidatus Saccharimonadia bacterium]